MDFETVEHEDTEAKAPLSKMWLIIFSVFFVLTILLCLVIYVHSLGQPSQTFPVGEDITIEEGTTLSEVSDQFKDRGLVKKGWYFYIILQLKFTDTFIQAGTYRFTEPLSTEALGKAITSGLYSAPPLSVTFPEGFRVKDILKYLPKKYATTSVSETVTYEGYLFPDTYFIRERTSYDEIINMMRKNYTLKTTPLYEQFASSSLTEHEIVTLASIVEREGNDAESMSLVAGILLRRLAIGMPLQVDATLDYLLDKTSDELTAEDLKNDSPYNTYMHTGLPPQPISNPGITALTAVLSPTSTKYLYYLTDSDGIFHYAQTFEEHKQNKERYLR